MVLRSSVRVRHDEQLLSSCGCVMQAWSSQPAPMQLLHPDTDAAPAVRSNIAAACADVATLLLRLPTGVRRDAVLALRPLVAQALTVAPPAAPAPPPAPSPAPASMSMPMPDVTRRGTPHHSDLSSRSRQQAGGSTATGLDPSAVAVPTSNYNGPSSPSPQGIAAPKVCGRWAQVAHSYTPLLTSFFARLFVLVCLPATAGQAH